METKKLRLDRLLVLKGIVDNISKAKAIVMSGKVFVDGKKIDKSGHKFSNDKIITLKKNEHNWVSRGGTKLYAAIKYFGVNPDKKKALDIGSSTGGFTEVLVSMGAKNVFAVDVGKGQLDWKLRNNSKVIVMEKTNARYLDENLISEKIDLIVSDVSFISLTLALDNPLKLAAKKAELLALIKPQFELKKEMVGKKGIVRNAESRMVAVNKIKLWLKEKKVWRIEGVYESPIKGAKGNIEFFIYARKKS